MLNKFPAEIEKLKEKFKKDKPKENEPITFRDEYKNSMLYFLNYTVNLILRGIHEDEILKVEEKKNRTESPSIIPPSKPTAAGTGERSNLNLYSSGDNKKDSTTSGKIKIK